MLTEFLYFSVLRKKNEQLNLKKKNAFKNLSKEQTNKAIRQRVICVFIFAE